MKVKNYEVTQTREGLVFEPARMSKSDFIWRLFATIFALAFFVLQPYYLHYFTLQQSILFAAFYLVVFGIPFLPPHLFRRKLITVDTEKSTVHLFKKVIPFDDITAITTEPNWWRHDVVIYTKQKTHHVFRWVTRYEGTRLCELICTLLPEKESLRLMPWGVSIWADSQRQTPTQ